MIFVKPRSRHYTKNWKKHEKTLQKTIKKITLFFIDFSSILAPKIDPKIDKNSTSKLTKTRYEKRSEKKQKKSPTWAAPARKPDLAGETESADKSSWHRAVSRCMLRFLFQPLCKESWGVMDKARESLEKLRKTGEHAGDILGNI